MAVVSSREAMRLLRAGESASVRTRWGVIALAPAPQTGAREDGRRWGLVLVEGLPTVVTIEQLVPGSHATAWTAPLGLAQQHLVAWEEVIGVGELLPATYIV